MFLWRLTVFFEVQEWNIFIKLDYQFSYFKPEINQTYLNVYFKGIKFRGYLISQLEKTYILRVLNFAIWWFQNISRAFNFAMSVKIRNESLIEYQCNCYQMCYRNSNFLTISRDMRYTSIIIIIWLNIRKKRIPNSAGL